MKITFIDPPNFLNRNNVERVFGCTYSLYPFPNIFSLSNAAILEKDGFDVRYIDMANEAWGIDRLRRFLKQDPSDIYVFHCVNLSIQPDLRVYEEIRDIRKETALVFSGPAPTYFARDFLKDNKTYVIRGETEFTILELARCLKQQQNLSHIKGLSFRHNSTIIDNQPRALIQDLDRLPYPARHLLKRDIYYNPKLPKRPFTAIETSRNCPYRCLFCVPNSASFACELEYRRYNLNQKPSIRLRSAESVIAEFKELKTQGYKSVSIIDDQFLWQEDRTVGICIGIKGLDIDWGCLARADHITEEIVKYMIGSGCRYVDIGVESFRQDILDYIRKDLKVEKIYQAVRLLKKYGILAKINLILGSSPLQTRQDIEMDIKKAKELDVDAIMFSIATPFPGTEFYKLAKENKWFTKGDYYPESVQLKAVINYPKLTNSELNWLIKKANLSFYFSHKFIRKNLKRLFQPKNFYAALKALKQKFL